jgi:hypothetical protein
MKSLLLLQIAVLQQIKDKLCFSITTNYFDMITKITKILSATILLVSLYSCGTFQTDVWLNGDGSGKMQTTFDIGAMMRQMEEMMSGMGNESEWDESAWDDSAWSMDFEDESEYGYDEYEEYEYSDEDYVYEEYDYDYQGEDEEEWEYDEADYDWSQNIIYDEDYDYDNYEMPEPTKAQLVLQEAMTKPVVDTIVSIYDIIEDSILAILTKPELLKNASIGIKANEEAKEMILTMVMNFSSIAQLRELNEQMKLMEQSESSGNMLDQFGAKFSGGTEPDDFDFDPIARKLTVHPRKMDLPEDITSEELEKLKEEPEKMEWALSMMGFNELSVTYHLPGPVVKVTGDVNYEIIESNSVRIPIDLSRVLSAGMTEGFEIYYK